MRSETYLLQDTAKWSYDYTLTRTFKNCKIWRFIAMRTK